MVNNAPWAVSLTISPCPVRDTTPSLGFRDRQGPASGSLSWIPHAVTVWGFCFVRHLPQIPTDRPHLTAKEKTCMLSKPAWTAIPMYVASTPAFARQGSGPHRKTANRKPAGPSQRNSSQPAPHPRRKPPRVPGSSLRVAAIQPNVSVSSEPAAV